MGYVVFDDVFDKERCDVDSNDGEDEIEPIEGGDVESCGEEVLYLPDEPMEDVGGHGSEESNEEG